MARLRLVVLFLAFSALHASPLLAVGEIVTMQRRIHAEASAVNPSGNGIEAQQTEAAPNQRGWTSAAAASARADELEASYFVGNAYQNSRGFFGNGGGFLEAQGWATIDSVRDGSQYPGRVGSRSVYDVTFTLHFPRRIVVYGSLRSEARHHDPIAGGALFLLSGDEGEIVRRQVGARSEIADLTFVGLLEPGTYRLLARANRGGGIPIGRDSSYRSYFDFTARLDARPLELSVTPLVRAQDAVFSVRDADPGIEVTVLATRNGLCPPIFCLQILNPPIVVVGRGIADGNGSLDVSVPIPLDAPTAIVHAIATQERVGPNGTFRSQSSPVETRVVDP